MPKSTEEQRSSQEQVDKSIPRITSGQSGVIRLPHRLDLIPEIQSYPPILNPRAFGKFNPF